MRLFAKLLLLAGVCAAVPLALLGGAGLWRSRRLAADLTGSAERTGAVTGAAGLEALFRESSRFHLEVVERRAQELETFFEQGRKMAGLQTALIDRALRTPPEAGGPPLYSDAKMAELIQDPAFSSRTLRVEPYVVYKVAPGADAAALGPTLDRLARLGDLYSFWHRETPWLKSLYFGSADGFLVGYPGGTPFPASYDPRQRDWYEKAVDKGRVTWSNIYLDKDKLPVITCAEPLFQDGKLVGVSAADVGLESLLDRLFTLGELPASDALLVNYLGQVRIAAAVQGPGKFSWRSWGPDDAPSVRTFLDGRLAPAFDAAVNEDSGAFAVDGKGRRVQHIAAALEGDLLSFSRVFIKTRAGGKHWYYLVRTPLGRIVGPALEVKGTLDKYEGDAVMAFWGAPVAQADHARRACWAALDNRSRLKEMCQAWEARGLPTFDIRIGINTGTMIVGNVGSQAHMGYTVLGDAVNTGARLEQANKLYGTHILVSEATRLAAGGAVDAREVDLLELRGKKKALRVYELLGLAYQLPPGRLAGYRLYEEGLAAYRAQRWDEAERALRGAIAALGTDKAASVLLQRVLVFRHHPPPGDWDGVIRVVPAGAAA